MILTALARYYRRLAAENDVAGNPKVPPYGFSEEKIGWVLVLDADGLLVDVVQHFTTEGKKPQPRLMSVPKTGGSNSNSIKPNFLWGNTQYILGVTKKETKDKDRTNRCFSSFREYHFRLLEKEQDKGLLALSRFLERWQPEQFAHPPCLPDMLDANVVFKLDGAHGYIHQCEAAQSLWVNHLQSDEAEQGLCLVSGEQAPIARTHPVIKGVEGGEKSGGMIISFNKESFTSFGKEQGANAPVSEVSAFAYTTALNYLLRRENGHCLTIGDASTVFWAEAATPEQAEAAEGFFAAAMTPPDDEQENQKIFDVLAQVVKGRPLREIDPNLDDQTRFYILGLAPNASRISIRFWLDTTFGKLAENIKKHRDDLSINPPVWGAKPPSVWRILLETTPKRKGADGRLKKSESKDIPPQLAGEYMRAILTGRHYPQTMLSRMIGRIRSDGFISGLRVAVIKSVLKRNNLCKEEFDMGLNEETQDIPYRLGRLFAIIELAQSSALGELNAGVRDKFYGGASSSPHSTFPLLLDNYRTHISGLRKGKKAKWVTGDSKKLANWLENKVGEIVSVFDAETPFPRHLSLEEQGRFVIGYYQQRFKKYSKQEGGDVPEDIELANHLKTESDSEDE
ncbi:type I-C CRISPR-associated protein Cas8c/Csd1 [Neisseria zoodegmatis]|uniref:Phage associated protein n=1 Tax=Neisseria zoodegmatis TaxID=326523 RepID=A0AB38DMX4_9NEIS|nr:type I-C CRISPR-associated protein Cas8c/Csd1 [Neisseria zoodegmatis]OSI09256.1 type I-C CRISPR-associated protein Cas8c/Csd1 [Neisseria zoodegmatis]SNU78718.1 phage associated protein [Neisseria zoodegmatis]